MYFKEGIIQTISLSDELQIFYTPFVLMRIHL